MVGRARQYVRKEHAKGVTIGIVNVFKVVPHIVIGITLVERRYSSGASGEKAEQVECVH